MRYLTLTLAITLTACAHVPAATPAAEPEPAPTTVAAAVPAAALPAPAGQSPSWRDCRAGDDAASGCDRAGPGGPLLNLAPVAMPAH